jgi:hypothetical protein
MFVATDHHSWDLPNKKKTGTNKLARSSLGEKAAIASTKSHQYRPPCEYGLLRGLTHGRRIRRKPLRRWSVDGSEACEVFAAYRIKSRRARRSHL